MHPLLESYRQAARGRVDPAAWDYVERGAGDGRTVAEAERAWDDYRLRPRVLRDIDRVDTGLELFGRWSTPIGVAPTAFHELVHPDAELATARAAGEVGAPFVLSTRSTRRIEEVAAGTEGPWWFQVYLMREQAVTDALVARAEAAGASALVLTVDTPYVGHRARTAALARPLPLSQDQTLVNVRDHLPPGTDDVWDLIDQRRRIVTADIGRLAASGDLPVIVKGILRADDAAACVTAGAAAVWVSNHGGRQLDRCVSTAAALPEVVARVGDAVPVLVDGGVRDGFDALTALALGAHAVLLGRPVLWGLAADGGTGVRALLTELTAELGHAMGLAGAARLADLDPSLVTGS